MSLIIIAGRLGKDPVIETTSGGSQVIKFSVVENEFKNGEEVTTWYDVRSYSPFIIEKQSKALFRGSFIIAPADVTIKPSFDKKGKLYINYDALVNSIKIVNVSGKKSENTQTETEAEDEPTFSTGTITLSKPEATAQKEATKPKAQITAELVDESNADDDDLPF